MSQQALLFYWLFLHRLRKQLQLLAYFPRRFLLSLRLFDGFDGIFNTPIALLQQLLCLGLCLRKNLLALPLQIVLCLLILRHHLFDILFLLTNRLAFTFPIALIPHNILQIFIALNVIRPHDFRSLSNHILGQSNLSCNLNSKRTTGSSDGQLKQGTHLVAVIKHRSIGHFGMMVGKML